ncbi:MAG: DUF58 domain-containing protein [Lachnospiraceae bacterium]|nr:DUF58 domain-containing protein [Lachnospiraceae bacterium]
MITIVLLYFAGSYHEASLLLLAVAWLLAEGALVVEAVYGAWAYRKGRLSVEPSQQAVYLVKGQYKAVEFRADNRLDRPVKIAARLRLLAEDGKVVRRQKHRPRGKNNFSESGRLVQRIRTGDHALRVEVRLSEIGMYQLVLDQIKVYDSFGLFGIPCGGRDIVQVSVYPSQLAAKNGEWVLLHLSQLGIQDREELMDPTAADNSMEIKGIREYRPDESVRHIHWKLSARFGKLQRKEYFNRNVEFPEPRAKAEADCPVQREKEPRVSFRAAREAYGNWRGIIYAAVVCVTLLVALAYGYHIHAETVLALLLGWMVVSQSAVFGMGSDRWERAGRGMQTNHRAWARSLMFGGVVFGLALAEVLVVRTGIYQAVFRAEKWVNQVIEAESAKYVVPRMTGRIAMGNRYTSGREVIRFTSTRQLEEPLYLRGFVGGTYEDGMWKVAYDQSILRSNQITDETTVFQGMHYTLNRFSPEGSRDSTELHVVHSNGKYDASTLYTPYFSQWMSFYYTEDDNPTWDQWFGLGKGYVYKCFEKHQMHVDWDHIADIYVNKAERLRRVQQEYLEAMYGEYTQVPEGLDRLWRVVQDNPRENVDEVTDFILEFLGEQAVYTTEPGRFTRGEDVVEQFLFEKHEGYCVHYASAAVLMYRMYGIPARYAAGYVFPVETYEVYGRLGCQAAALDEQGHAWAEIYLEDYGWLPVEVTYDAVPDLKITEPYPGYGSGESTVYGKVRQTVQGGQVETNRINLRENQTSGLIWGKRGDRVEAVLDEEDDLAHFSVVGELWNWAFMGTDAARNRTMAAVLVAYLLGVIAPTAWIFYRQEERLRILEGDCGYVYGKLLALCARSRKQRMGGERSNGGTREPRCEDEVRLADSGVFSAEEIERIFNIAEKHAFSERGADETDTAWMREAYFKAYAYVNKKL